MTDDRWARLDSVLQAALVRPAEARDQFVKQACGDDAALRDEVLSLLAHAASARDFLEPAPGGEARPLLTPGQSLGRYTVGPLIGRGGMGEVYRARDAHPPRDIAIKVLPPEFATDPDRLRRFEHEAHAVAALNHPNIVTLYSVEEAGGLHFLTLELVEGQPLSDLIPRDGLPLDRLLDIAVPLADAIGTAHARGIVHRDLKPGNVKVTPEGRVKVLDFGLAKLQPLAVAADVATVSLPTASVEGRLLGTVAYMSPEQAEGREVDQRSDIFSLGVVLYELATGRRPFMGESSAALLSSILRDSPPLVTELRPELPQELARIVRRCVAKPPDRRYQSAIDLRNELEEVRQDLATGALPTTPSSASSQWRRLRRFAWVAGGVAAVALGTLGYFAWLGAIDLGLPARQAATATSVFRLTIADVSPAEEVGTNSARDVLPGGSRKAVAWSPDGRTLAYVGLTAGVRKIYMRELDRDVARPLDGTEGARALTFSADGQWVAFWAPDAAAPRGAIRKVRAAGGPATKIRESDLVTGISWGSARIVYTLGHRLLSVSPDGGEPLTLHTSTGSLSSPVLLPGETAVMYTEHDKSWTSGDERILALPLSGAAAPRRLLSGAADAQYMSSGHLAFLRQGTLHVVAFDAESLDVRRGEVPVLKGVAQAVQAWASPDLTLIGQFAISQQGDLAYLSGSPSIPVTEPVAINRRGDITPLGAQPDTYKSRVESSPDGLAFALSLSTGRSLRLAVYDRIRGGLKTPLAEVNDREVYGVFWSTDGKIALNVMKGGAEGVEIYTLGSPEAPEPVTDSAGFIATSWSRDGDRLLGIKATDLWFYSPRSQGSRWTQLRASPSNEQWPAWSPDGRWVSYASNISRPGEVYVEPYPERRAPIPISTAGGGWPAWNPKGGELFYVEGGGGASPAADHEAWMMSVDMTVPDRPGKPVRLFPFKPASLLLTACNPHGCYSLAPDGQTFYALRIVRHQVARVTQINLIVNWFEEVKRLLAAQ